MGIFSKLFPKPADGEGSPTSERTAAPEAPTPPQPPTAPNPQSPASGVHSTTTSGPIPPSTHAEDGAHKKSSPRPPTPQAATPGPEPSPQAGPSIAETFERLLSLEDVDSGFAAIERRKSDRAPALDGSHDADLSEVRELFALLAANHVRQVRDFMNDVRRGQATVEWLDICEPAIRSLHRAAERLSLPDLCAALDAFAATLAAARSEEERTLDDERRDAIVAGHAALAAIMPQAFALDLDRSQREGVILQSLLAQIPNVRKVTIDKLYSAGMTTLEAMLLATPEDLVSTTGIEHEIAEQIVERFHAYAEAVITNAPDPTRAHERARIAELAASLHTLQTEFDRADAEWSKEANARKRELRRARAQTVNDLNVILARLGEVDLLNELERTSFEQKVVRIEAFLRDASAKYEQAGKD